MKYYLCLIFWLGLLLNTPAEAKDYQLYAEPYAGYTFVGLLNVVPGNQATYVSPEKFQFSGIGLGLRVGSSWKETLYAALDLLVFPSMTSNNLNAPSWWNTQLGITAGAQIPAIPMRFWIGYNFLNLLSPRSYLIRVNQISDAVSLAGYAFKIGTGYRIYSPVFVNVEAYFGAMYAFAPSGKGWALLLNSTVIAYSHVLATVSAPFNFFGL